MVYVSNQDLITAIPALRALSVERLPVKTSFSLVSANRHFESLLKDIEIMRLKLIDAYGRRDASGALEMLDDGSFELADPALFAQAWAEVMAVTMDIPCASIPLEALGNILLSAEHVAQLHWLIEA